MAPSIWLNILKQQIVPALTDIVGKIALHTFTKPKANSSALHGTTDAQKQIQELQTASNENTETIKAVALQLESTVKVIEESSKAAEASVSALSQQVQQLRKYAIVSALLAVLAIVCAVFALLVHK